MFLLSWSHLFCTFCWPCISVQSCKQNQLGAQFILSIFINLHVFQATMGPSSFIPPCIPDSHPHRITSTKCRTNTAVSPNDGHIKSCPITGLNRPTGFQEAKTPRFLDNRHMNVVGDDGHIVARNMYRVINILRINRAPSWFHLQEAIYVL